MSVFPTLFYEMIFNEEQKNILSITTKENSVLNSLVKTKNILRLSKDVKIPRATLYPILQKLYSRGFIRSRLHGQRYQYQTVPPEVFHRLFEKLAASFKKEMPVPASAPKETAPQAKNAPSDKPGKLPGWFKSIFK